MIVIDQTTQVSKALLSLWLVCIVGPYVFAQHPSTDQIKKTEGYYWGEATAETEAEATDRAIAQLTQKIAVSVSASFEHKTDETAAGVQSTVQSIVRTYSLATLKDLNKRTQSTSGGILVFCFISKEEVRKIFESRIRTVESIYDVAVKLQEERGDFGQALKFYYFAAILMGSVPNQTIDYNGNNLVVEIPRRIDEILTNTRLALVTDRKVAENERDLTLAVTVLGRPAATLEFTFWDGTGQAHVQAVDGEAVVKLYGASVSFEKLDAAIKYSYYECREEIKEVADLWNVVSRPSFKSNKRIDLTKVPRQEKAAALRLDVRRAETGTANDLIMKETLAFVELLRKNDTAGIRERYAADPFLRDRILQIVRYNNPKVVDETIKADINRTYTGWEVRKIRVLNTYPSLRKQTLDYLILDFTAEARLEDVNFGLMDNLYEKFVKEGKELNDWQDRQVMVKFMERYRTSFLSRNIAMLDSMFADEAVIIIGRVLHKSRMTDTPIYAKLSAEQPDFQTIRYRKDEYLRNQKRTFENQKDILLGYSTFSITKKNKQPRVYGLSLRQSYNSTTYSDEGYLFLLIDFNEQFPQIYVRAWQPQEWNEESLIGLANFNLNR